MGLQDADTDTNWFASCGSFGRPADRLRATGIRQACGALIRPLDPDPFAPVRPLKDAALRHWDRFPEFYLPGMQIHPRSPDESCREIERLCDGEGVRWIGERVGCMMGFGKAWDSPEALAVFQAVGGECAPLHYPA